MNSNPTNQIESLNDLVDSTLVSITFVLDYLQLAFEKFDLESGQYYRLILTTLLWPVLEQEADSFAIGGNQYFDVMYRQISATVVGCNEIAMSKLNVELSTRLSLNISLQPEDQVDAETVILHNELTHQTTVW